MKLGQVNWIRCTFKNMKLKTCRFDRYCKYWWNCHEEGINDFTFNHRIEETKREARAGWSYEL